MKSYSEDILFQNDTPIFATAKAPITLIKNGVLDERETEMLLSDGVCLLQHFMGGGEIAYRDKKHSVQRVLAANVFFVSLKRH